MERGFVGMATMARAVMVVLVAVVPGGLLALAAYALARVVAVKMRVDEGSNTARLARAVAQVRLSDVWREARQVM
jgi:hypothetical protein